SRSDNPIDTLDKFWQIAKKQVDLNETYGTLLNLNLRRTQPNFMDNPESV
ncbi:unnamed protein product, partial [Didymodactylos carnosus]